MFLSWFRKLSMKKMNQAAKRGQEKPASKPSQVKPHIEALEDRTLMSASPTRPLLVLPGIGGTFVSDPNLADDWYINRSFNPNSSRSTPWVALTTT